MKDAEILDLYWARSETAIDATAKKYGSYCRSISYNILHNDFDAEECVNDTWLGAWNSIPPQRPNPLSVYLGKLVRNLSLNRFKLYTAQKRGGGQTELILSELGDCIPAGNTVEQTMEEKALVEALEHFLRTQPRERRNIFLRRYWYMCPVRQIAAERGVSSNRISTLLYRMRQELKDHLEKEGFIL